MVDVTVINMVTVETQIMDSRFRPHQPIQIRIRPHYFSHNRQIIHHPQVIRICPHHHPEDCNTRLNLRHKESLSDPFKPKDKEMESIIRPKHLPEHRNNRLNLSYKESFRPHHLPEDCNKESLSDPFKPKDKEMESTMHTKADVDLNKVDGVMEAEEDAEVEDICHKFRDLLCTVFVIRIMR